MRRNQDMHSQGRVKAPGVGATGIPGAGRRYPLPETVTKFLPQDRPIPSAVEFNVLGQIGTAAVGTVLPVACRFQIPAGYSARISSFLIGATDVLASTALTWTFRANEVPIPGYTNLAVFVGVASRLVNTFDAFVLLYGPTMLDLAIANGDGGTYSVGGGITGWYWQTEAGESWLKSSAP